MLRPDFIISIFDAEGLAQGFCFGGKFSRSFFALSFLKFERKQSEGAFALRTLKEASF
jgi:hypothetical protein